MYTPKFFVEDDEEKILAFMREFNFATVVTAADDLPTATHLPFIVEKRGDCKVILAAHMAKANLQWESFETSAALVIFQEPHAYVSPLLYEEMPNVPTWNYVAVHAYGRARIFEASENLALLEKQVEAFDPEYFQTEWRNLTAEYKTNLAKGVVAFEIEVADLQGKKKLNQNKPGRAAEKVIETFEKSERENERQIARFMKEIYRK